ncbi:MAG: MFS transporter, partial [Sedimentisphaerales bacterium]|nr:MFS transporter [Sedimentisphaerales bacterium]
MLADMYSNILPPILPALRQQFGLNLFKASVLVVLLLLSSNWFQVLAGHLRSDKQDRWFMYLGLVLAAVISAIGLVPPGTHAMWSMAGLTILAGAGIAMVHPDALRSVHRLSRIPGATSTGIFMASGFVGYAIAGWASTALVSRWGLKALSVLGVLPVLGILALTWIRARPALEAVQKDEGMHQAGPSFWDVMAMAIPAAIATTVFGTLLPTRLVDELGFGLRFGGYSAAVYGTGGAIGSVIWGIVARRIGDLPAAVIALALVMPLTGLYLFLMGKPAAIAILFLVGFFAFASYILLVTVAGTARGSSLSMRMAWVVGGSWGISHLALLGLAMIADRYGTLPVMAGSPIGYLAATAFGISILRRHR